MRRRVILCLTTVLLALGAAAPASARAPFPDVLPLPAGFYPEGIAVGTGATFYVGSLLDGAIYGGSLRTGTGDVVVPGKEGRVVAGLTFDDRSRLLWGVGFEEGVGAVFVFRPAAGALLDVVPLPGGLPGSLPNDLVIADGTVYVTDSFSDVLWTIPLNRRGLPAAGASALPLSGDFQFVSEEDLPVNLNGIVATPSGNDLIAVHSTLGVLYRIDPGTGAATLIDVTPLVPGTEPPLLFGDGLLLHGRTLYVVQNFLDQVTVVELAPDLASGAVVEVRTSPLFHVPATVARFGSSLYLVNARFDESLPPLFSGEPPDTLDYEVVRIDR